LPIGLNAVLEAVKLPACIADLDTRLSDVDGNDFTHIDKIRSREIWNEKGLKGRAVRALCFR